MKLELNNGHIFTYQTPATVSQAAAVQNTWYTILDTTSNAIIYDVCVKTTGANETLEVQITIDGETIAGEGVACTDGQVNKVYRYTTNAVDGIALNTNYAGGTGDGAFLIMGKSIKIEVRKTTNNGAITLSGQVTYGVLEAI